MSDLLEIAERLQETQSALLELEKAVIQNPLEKSLLLTRDTLLKRQTELEKDFGVVADKNCINVCSYRLFSESNKQYAIMALANSLRDFQTWFTVIYDAIKNGPKQRARYAPEIAAVTALHFGYTFTGSVGFSLTMNNEQVLFGNTEFDSAMIALFEMARSESSDQIAHFAKKYGSASIRQMYRWVSDQVQGVMGADIEWRRKDEVRANLVTNLAHLENLKLAIEETSDEHLEVINLRGDLVGLDVDRGIFHMKFPDSEDIKGDISDSIGSLHTVEIPKTYTAVLRKTTKINYATDKEAVEYYLIQIT